MTATMIGQRVKRVEDPALLTGNGRYIDDIRFAGMAEAAFVRSPHPHAIIRGIGAAAARALPGVHAVYTLADLMPHLKSDRLPLDFAATKLPEGITQWVLARDEVCYVGELVAAVVADSRYIAEDAAALVEIDYEPLPSVGDCAAAIELVAPRVHRGADSNVLVEFGQDYGDCDAAFANAPHVFRETLRQHRGGAHPIECRGAVARFDAVEDRLTLWSSTQMSHEVRAYLIKMIGYDENRVRVIAPNVGGGFGAKFRMYAEEVVVALASIMLDRPVKWIEDRCEHFLDAMQERDQYWDVEVAADADGRLLGVRGTVVHDHGAYTPQGLNMPYNASTAVPGPYVLPSYRIKVYVVETNKVPTMPVRGAGYPEGTFAMERLIDRIARELGLDRAEVRRRNLIPAGEMPYTRELRTRAGAKITHDSGDYPRCQELALEAIDYAGFAERRDRARAEGRYIGIGIGTGVKGTGRGPFECATVRIERSGKVSVFTGAVAIGQGTQTLLAQICSEHLGVPVEDIHVVGGDTTKVATGMGAFGSRQTATAGSAVHISAQEARAKVLKMASHLLEAAEEDLDLDGGRVYVKGAADLSLGLDQIGEALSGVPGYSIPGHIEPGLEFSTNFRATELAYSNGVQAVEVEVDPDTGGITLLRHVAVCDIGTPINPMMVDGQMHGGVVHGIGNAMFEWMRFDAFGQPMTTTLADYLLPTAPHIPEIEIVHHASPSPLNPLGAKGVGECGTLPAAPAIIAAVENALEPFGVRVSEYPITPPRIVELIGAARAAS